MTRRATSWASSRVRPTPGRTESDAIADRLKEIDVDGITPRQALELLAELKKWLRTGRLEIQNSEFRMQTGRRRRKAAAAVGTATILHSEFCITPRLLSSTAASRSNIITIAARVGPNNLHPLKANDEGTARVGQLM